MANGDFTGCRGDEYDSGGAAVSFWYVARLEPESGPADSAGYSELAGSGFEAVASIFLLEGEDFFPVILHADYGPAFGVGLIEGLIKFADGGVAVVGILADGVGVVDEEHKAGTGAGGCPFEHLLVAVGVAEGGDWVQADVGVDADGFAGAVVDEADLRQPHDDGSAVLRFKLCLHSGADDLIGRDAVGFFCPRTHECGIAAGDDEGFETVGA